MTDPGGQINDKIEGLTAETEEISKEAVHIAKDASSGGKIKTDRVDWVRVEDLMEQYELWYNDALVPINSYLPKREPDFVQAYSNLTELIYFKGQNYTKWEEYNGGFRRNLTTQKHLLRSIPSKIETEQLRVRRGISDEIINEELHQAKELYEDGLIRPAGVVTGVALERHLTTLCEVSDRDIEFEYDFGIKALADALYDENEVTKTQHGQIEYLGKLRNKCAHADKEEPTTTEVDRLISQTEEIVRETPHAQLK